MPIHSTAIVAGKAIVDPTAILGPYVVVDDHVTIGAETVLDPFVRITGHTTIGTRCRIHSGAVIGDFPQDRSFHGEVSYCQVGNDAIIRENVTIHRGTAPGSKTVVGNRCFFLAGSHVGHNCVVGDGVTLVNGSMLGGHVQVGNNAIISGGSAVHQFVRIGDLAMVGGISKVTRDIPPYFLVDGVGVCIGTNVVGMRRAGLTAEDREEVRQAYRILFRSGLLLAQAIQQVDETLKTVAGRLVAEFLTKPSKRGLSMGLRSHGDAAAENVA